MKVLFIGGMLLASVSFGSKKNKIADTKSIITVASPASSLIDIYTDKAFYKPGDKIIFKTGKAMPVGIKIRYKRLGTVIHTASLTGTSWSWIAPPSDYTGYMIELYNTINGKEKIYGTIAVDVSSDPSRFPRNGFLSEYGQKSHEEIHTVMKSLNRYHINYVQFQDWEYKHHLPLAGTLSSPDSTWKDIANRDNYAATVKGYISAAHVYNMKTLHYNLIYGALNDAETDGVQNEWHMYKDQNHTTKEVNTLPQPTFKSDLFLMDPSNKGWQQYLAAKTNQALQVYPFDGYQIDQLGNRDKTLYNYKGQPINLTQAFNSFIKAMKVAMPQKSLIMNAVNQYGQDQISAAPVDFLYSEVWTPNEGYKDLATFIQNNDALTNGVKKSVICAYMDYDNASNPGYFSTPGVLLTDAVIFAFGGSHLELGEHMLGKEYFPNNNLQMPDDLKAAMINYYDFLTAYENLLRDGGSFNKPGITSVDNRLKLNYWPPQSGQVSVVGKDMGNRQVIHLINMANANSLNWRDNKGTQPQPIKFNNATFNFSSSKAVKRIWVASPDIDGGASKDIIFTKSGNSVTFTLPSLYYWNMVVVEYR